MARIDAFLQLGREQGCSDVHLSVGVPPMLRRHGELVPVKYRDLGAEELQSFVYEILNQPQKERFESGLDIDFSYATESIGGYRVNVFHKLGGVGATFRVIPKDLPTMDALGLPPSVQKLVYTRSGLVLVTGATGTGKSTTLSALLHYMNQNFKLNIVTLEDPVEVIHKSDKSLVIQREIGTHVPSFADGLRAALRENPDVVLVGELRDTETISLALTAAETGHLVFGTLHTSSAVKTLDRIIDALPPEQKAQGTLSLAQNLRAVISQVLVRVPDGKGRKALFEVMFMNSAMSNLLLSGKAFQIPMKLETGREQGMQTMDQALMEGINRKEIDPDHAYLFATDKKQFQRFVTDPTLLPQVSLVGR